MACRTCGTLFQPVDWLPWRVDGYCGTRCVPEEKVKKTVMPPKAKTNGAQKMRATKALKAVPAPTLNWGEKK